MRRWIALFALLLLCSTAPAVAAARAEGGASPVYAVPETPATGATIKLSASRKTIKKGATFTIKSAVSPKRSGQYVRYRSSDTAVARVSQAGKVKGVGYGDAVITATYGDQVAACQVTVTGPLKKIALNAKSAACEIGQTIELRIAAANPFNADLGGARWISSKPGVARVDGGVVTAIGVGRATITCKVGKKSAACVVSVLAPAGADEGAAAGSMEVRVLELVNRQRRRAGLGALSYHSPLEGFAQVRVREILRSFSHTRPNGSSCFTAIQYRYAWAGENIAMGFDAPEDVMDAWMNSPGHRANILNKNFTEMGVGIYSADGCTFWVQMFTKKK